MRINHSRFFDGYAQWLGAIGAKARTGLDRLLDLMESDGALSRREAAYLLATVKHETAGTFEPIREYGRGAGKAYGRTYYGRGYVQLTWRSNYQRAGELLGYGSEFVQRPDGVMEPSIAYAILSRGMREGWFTGKRLGDYITASGTDYVNARRVVNGTDRATKIAEDAQRFERVLATSEGSGLPLLAALAVVGTGVYAYREYN